MPTATFGRARAALARANATAAPAATAPAAVAPPAPTPTPAAEIPAEVVATAAAVRRYVEEDTTTAVAVRDARPLTAVRGLQGEWGARDAAIPFIAIVQRTSGVADEHPDWIGNWCYDKSENLGPELVVVFTNLVKFYEEATEFGSGDIPQRFDSMEQVRAAGLGTADVNEVVLADVLVRAATDEQYERCTLVDESDVGYYPARLAIRSSALGTVKGVLIRDLAGWLKGKMEGGFYKITASKRSNPKGIFWVPTMAPAGSVPPGLAARLEALLA